MKKSLVLILAVAVTIAGCSKNESRATQDNDNTTPIAVMGRSLDVSTRAPFEGEISASNMLTAMVPASLKDGDYTTQYALGTMTFGLDDTAVKYASDAIGNRNYPVNGATNVYLAGLYPATGWDSYGTTAAITFTGNDDVMSAPQISTNKADATTPGSYKKLTFSHLLTKLEIRVVANDAVASAAWGTIKEITLTKRQNSTFNNIATVNLSSGIASFTGAVPSWAVYNGDVAITAGTIEIPAITAVAAGYTIVSPIVATTTVDADFTIGIKTLRDGVEYSKDDITISLKDTDGNDFSGSTAGKNFVITLTFKVQDIQAKAKVTPWVNGGSANSDIN